MLPVLAIIYLLTDSYLIAQSSVAATTISNCQTQIVTLNCGNVNNNTSYNASFPVTTNQIITINSIMGIGDLIYTTANNITNDLRDSGGSSINSSSPLPITLTGLKSITLVSNGGSVFAATLTILTPSTNSISYTPVNSVVIPSDAIGNVQIILESSSDLVNWIPSLPGTYGSTYTNRFFRVRAVAQ